MVGDEEWIKNYVAVDLYDVVACGRGYCPVADCG